MILKIGLSIACMLLSLHSKAEILRGGGGNPKIDLQTIISETEPGTILIIGEQHGQSALADEQLELLQGLRTKFSHIHVGMEFLSYPDQTVVDQYRDSLFDETQFLAKIKWGKLDYANYRRQILFPQKSLGDVTLALNAPRALTGAISKRGLDQLSDEEKALLPPDLSLGNADYRERFTEMMLGSHIDEAAVDRYFQAQSTWDDTMAWSLLRTPDDFMNGLEKPDTVLVIVVGEFHVQYGGGLPDRIRARYPSKTVKTLSQLQLGELSPEDRNAEIQPHSKYGARADYLLIHDEQAKQPTFFGMYY